MRTTHQSGPWRRRLAAGAGVVTLAVTATTSMQAAAQSSPASQAGTAAITAATPADWPMWQKDLIGTRSNQAETAITSSTVAGLTLKWAYVWDNLPFQTTGSQPAVVGGVLYVGGPRGKFVALNAQTGATIWTYDTAAVAGPSTSEDPNALRDGATVTDGKVYFGDSRGWVYAVNADTGTLAWATRVHDHPNAQLTGSPLVWEGKLFIGVSSDEGALEPDPTVVPCCTFQGKIISLDANTGAVRWQYTTMPTPQLVGTWPSGLPKYAPSGGPSWSSPVINTATRTIYIGTGNNYTGDAGDIDSQLALNADTGAVRWKRQLTPHDAYTVACASQDPAIVSGYCPQKADGHALDFDFGATGNVVTARSGRLLYTVGQKGGKYRAFDPATGALVWERELAQPNLSGPDPGQPGIEWGSSWDGRRVYAATWIGPDPSLNAMDPDTGKLLWRTPHPPDGCTTGGAAQSPPPCFLGFTQAVSTTPGLVYTGSTDGKIRIFAAGNGKLVWQYDTVRTFTGVNGGVGQGSGLSGNGGPVISNGMLYVQSGYFPFFTTTGKQNVLLAFGL